MLNVFYVYVLKSPKSAALYYGFSSNLKQRFKKHQEMPKHARTTEGIGLSGGSTAIHRLTRGAKVLNERPDRLNDFC